MDEVHIFRVHHPTSTSRNTSLRQSLLPCFFITLMMITLFITQVLSALLLITVA